MRVALAVAPPRDRDKVEQFDDATALAQSTNLRRGRRQRAERSLQRGDELRRLGRAARPILLPALRVVMDGRVAPYAQRL